ncbi:MAG: adenosylcobinamide-phosphate synthase CbiB [Clostridiales bacterium]
MKIVIIIICAVVLDLVFGDPIRLPHPICLIGNTVNFLEKKIRKVLKNKFVAGIILVFIVAMLSFFIPFVILYLANMLNYYLGLVIEIYFCYQILAIKSLKIESMKVYYQLINDNLQESRKYLSYIVGRDTQDLDMNCITKATVETVSENTTDGVVAPIIFMAIGGAPLAFLYKAINTMDSMIGYKNEKYFYFGKFAAWLDDIANFIPARIAAVIMIFSSFILRMNSKNAIKIYCRDKRKHRSPNSAQTESVCAGALDIQLGGEASYFGKLIKKPTIGDNIRKIKPKDIILVNRLMYVTGIIVVFLAIIIRGVICV